MTRSTPTLHAGHRVRSLTLRPTFWRGLWPLLNWTLFAIGAAYCLAVAAGVIQWPGREAPIGTAVDAWAYYSTDLDDPYLHSVVGDHGSYLYSPVFLQTFSPLQLLPWGVFVWLWTALHLAAVAWLAPWMLVFPGVVDDVVHGNINTFLAVAVVLSIRYPAAWALPLLTKVTPGIGLARCIGLRDWRGLSGAIAVTAGIAAVSFALAPDLWYDWVASLQLNATQPGGSLALSVPLALRLPVAAALALMSARWVWLLPVAATVAHPNLTVSAFAVLAALPRLTRDAGRAR